MKLYSLSVIIIAKNEEDRIGRCLESVAPVADEIIVLDSGSEDKTVEIDLNEQANIYSAVLAEAITRDWIVGINSLGFQPAVSVQDAGSSVHGKPAFDVLSYVFNQVIN